MNLKNFLLLSSALILVRSENPVCTNDSDCYNYPYYYCN